jgi:hypothetical protein
LSLFSITRFFLDPLLSLFSFTSCLFLPIVPFYVSSLFVSYFISNRQWYGRGT